MESVLFQLTPQLGLGVSLDAMVSQLFESAQASPPVLAGLVLANLFEQICRPDADVLVLVKQAQCQVEESGMRFGSDGEQQTYFVVGKYVLGESQVDLPALGGVELLRAQTIMHVMEVKAFEWANRVDLSKVLSRLSVACDAI